MSKIRDLKLDENGWFADGKFDSISLFQNEINVCIFIDDGASEEDAERCIIHYNSLMDKKEMYVKIQEGLEKFFLYIYDEWKAFNDIYGDIVDSLNVVMDEYKEGKNLISFLSDPTLFVFPQKENEIGYGIACNCPWEPEHQCLILIRNNTVVYVGPSEGLDPWGDEEDYYCIWNENDED